MKAVVDQELCVGCGICPEVCPEVFQMQEEEHKAHVIADPVPPANEEAARKAALDCPVEAITIVEA